MNLRYFKNILPVAATTLVVAMSSCTKDLDVTPIDPNLTLETTEAQAFTKCYANLGMESYNGANGDCDISGYDGGTTGFIRQIFNANTLTTDEAICGLGDEGISDYVFNTYTSAHPMLEGLYYRLFYGVTMCNDYLYKFSGTDATRTAEIRFLRALYYYELMDLYANVPLVTKSPQEDATSEQKSRAEIFKFIEDELLAVAGESGNNTAVLSEPKVKTADKATGFNTNDSYGRADKAAAWMLLMRLYLNAEVYTGTAQWDKAATYAKKVIDSPYHLWKGNTASASSYQMLFMGDNGSSGASCEAILPILQDGAMTSGWAGALFLIASTTKSDMGSFGTTEYWGGNRARPQLIAKFFPKAANTPTGATAKEMADAANDNRAIFFSAGDGRSLTIPTRTDISDFTKGYSVAKWTNIYSDQSASHSSQFIDTDVFFLRAAEAYLAYAEATARQNGGKTTKEGTDYVNEVRQRAKATTKNSTTESYSLSELLDEWSREFYFEGHRRVDLIRFGQFGGSDATYKWAWKGGDANGTIFSKERNVFAIPATEINAAQGAIKQNTGY